MISLEDFVKEIVDIWERTGRPVELEERTEGYIKELEEHMIEKARPEFNQYNAGYIAACERMLKFLKGEDA